MMIKTLIDNAIKKATTDGAEHVLVEHLTVELLKVDEIQKLLFKHGLTDLNKVYEDIDLSIKTQKKHTTPPTLSFNFETIIKHAITDSIISESTSVQFFDVLRCIIRDKSLKTSQILKNNGVNIIKLIEDLCDKIPHHKLKSAKMTDKNSEKTQKQSYVTKFTEELTTSENLKVCIGREKEIYDMVHTLIRKEKNNIMMVGNSGVGKTTILHGLYNHLSSLDESHSLYGSRFFLLNVVSLISGTSQQGMLEDRMMNLVGELSKIKNSLLVLADVHLIAHEYYPLIKSIMMNKNIKVLTSITDDDYRQYFSKDSALIRNFFVIDVNEPNKDECISILKHTALSLEKFYKVSINGDVFETVYETVKKYVHKGSMPSKAIDLLDAACASMSLQQQKKKKTITSETILEEISKTAKVSSVFLGESDKTAMRLLKERLYERIIGQDHAIEELVKNVFVAKMGLKTTTKPILNILFQGPTSCGKTELSKCLAEMLGVELMRFDLSAYQEKFSLSALIGSPPGYLGYSDGRAGDGLLVTSIENNPNGVLLLDEIEKAHPDILNVLLQIMDYGILTSAGGRKVDCKNIMVIMTSNIGSDVLEKNRIGFGSSDNSDKFDEAFKNFFKPEFRSRLDGVVKFNKLSMADMMKITTIHFNKLKDILFKKGFNLSISDECIANVSNRAMMNSLGARNVDHIINNEISPIIATHMIEHEQKNIFLTVENNNFKLLTSVE